MQVYALTGVPPEIQAYAMAKYSRSAQSMRESIAELSAQRTEEFLNTFYFQYGHRSIADLAHVALAVEDVSILAAIRVVDEPLWDGQERSTRYQDFRKSGYVTPSEIAGTSVEQRYHDAEAAMFSAYHALTKSLTELLAGAYPAPAEVDSAAHRRTLRARAFDVARYLLPLATKTSVGQITSARVLERQISRLGGDGLAEVRAIGDAIRDACREPGFDLTRSQLSRALNGHATTSAAITDALQPVAPAPTLVKYAAPAHYAAETRARLEPVVRSLLDDTPPDLAPAVRIAPPASVEIEAVTSLLFTADNGGRSYLQVQAAVAELTDAQRAEILDLAFAGRGPHDEWLRELHAGYPIVADMLVDIGAFRDLHRHRRCIQLIQPFSAALGFDSPQSIIRDGLGVAADAALDCGAAEQLRAALAAGGAAAQEISATVGAAGAYALPLGYRARVAFKMDIAEAAYISELRTKPGGHFSYRRIAYLLYEALAERHPYLARSMRVTDPTAEDRLLER